MLQTRNNNTDTIKQVIRREHTKTTDGKKNKDKTPRLMPRRKKKTANPKENKET
jgi:hypothetical protein